jgi:hypothetical protein
MKEAMKLTVAQKRVLGWLRNHGAGALGTERRTTIKRLEDLGLIESFVPVATTWAGAARGRARYWRLTVAAEKLP